MGRAVGDKVKQKDIGSTGPDSLTINLFGPGMTPLHRAGVAGLWMTLRALESDRNAKTQLQKSGGSWKCTSDSVSLRWNGDAFFKTLFEQSFRIDKNGF